MGVAALMLIALIAASVIAGGWWLLVPRSWRADGGQGRHQRGTGRKGTGHGSLALGMSMSAFLMAGWLAFLSSDVSSPLGHVFHDLSIVLFLTFAVLFLCFISIATLGRPRLLIPAALRQQAHQRPDHPTAPTGQSHDGAHETGTMAMAAGPPNEGHLAGEIRYATFLANMLQAHRNFGGRVTVTNRRITFVPVTLSQANGGRNWQLGLEQVLAADLAPRSFKTSDGAGRRRLRIKTHTGTAAYFVVWQPRRKAALINRARQGRASGQ
jgi:hypothetical protein